MTAAGIGRASHAQEVDVRSVAVGRTLLIAGLCALIPLVGNIVASFLTEWAGGRSWLVVPAVGVGVAMLTALIQAEHTAHLTRVRLAARNNTRTALSLPLFGNCVFVGDDGSTLEADPFRSRWSETMAPGSVQCGAVIFNGHPSGSVTRASLSFAQIFGPGGGSITVRGLRLRPA